MSYSALGISYNIGTPLGPQKFDIPVEKVAKDMASRFMSEAWPIAKTKVYAELPKLMDQAVSDVRPAARAEADRAIDVGTSRAVMIATGLSVVIIGAAWWIRRGK